MRRISFIFVVSLVLNLIWENLHVVLYANYMGGEITQFILLKASVADALITVIITFPFVFYAGWKRRDWIIILVGVVVALGNEYKAFLTDRWAYNSLMPIIPILQTGLTPTIQIGLLAYLTYKLEEQIFN